MGLPLQVMGWASVPETEPGSQKAASPMAGGAGSDPRSLEWDWHRRLGFSWGRFSQQLPFEACLFPIRSRTISKSLEGARVLKGLHVGLPSCLHCLATSL